MLLAAVVAGNFKWTWATKNSCRSAIPADSSTPAIAAGLAMGVGLLVFAAVVVALAYRAWILPHALPGSVR